ncbi:MAG: fumarylacetoacetase [Rhodospirillaceae bacterium]|nr:fumarylacetoacetase [Rhodospirillaceae bacterium]MBT5810651.1 fumarylacetoacetase [Rhodospirillaceae bacterium]
MAATNETHDVGLSSWVSAANAVDTDFPMQNLPFGVFRRHGDDEPFRGGVAIGDQILDMAACVKGGFFDGVAAAAAAAAAEPTLNSLMALGPSHWSALRLAASRLLRTGSANQTAGAASLVPMDEVEYAVPSAIANYTDFYTSLDHATNGGRLNRREPPLFPNFKHLPVAYHGRASSVTISGAPCRRPWGQIVRPGADGPSFEPARMLDYEMEIGAYVGVGNPMGYPIPLAEADQRLFGLCLLNDWSARDIQGWEMAPLGPFLSKSFMTSVSPWVVTMEALAPFRMAAANRGADAPALSPHLNDPTDRLDGGLDVTVDVYLLSERMRADGLDPALRSRGYFRKNYWTVFQMMAHHASNGCNLQTGDLYGSGTVSGPVREEMGCLLEITDRGALTFELPGGETRAFLEDGDEVIFRGQCLRDGFATIGFGECRGRVAPAHDG